MSAERDLPMNEEPQEVQRFTTLDLDSMQASQNSEIADQRHTWANRFQTILPIEIQLTPGALDKAQDMRAEGYPIIFPYAHSRMRDPIDAIGASIRMGRGFDNSRFSGPVAYHQWQKPYIRTFARLAGMDASPIVTASTIEKGKDFESISLSKQLEQRTREALGHLPGVSAYERPEPRKIPSRRGLNASLDSDTRTLQERGIVFTAPQGERLPELGESSSPVIGALVRRAERNGVDMDRVGVWPMGIMIMDEEDPERHDDNFGLIHSVGKKAIIRLESPKTVKELRTETEKAKGADDPDATLDSSTFKLLRRVLPHSYYDE